jgi:hypothetical protein
MRLAAAFVVGSLAIAVPGVLITQRLERTLVTERERAQQFSAVVAACANGESFDISTTRVNCKPRER